MGDLNQMIISGGILIIVAIVGYVAKQVVNALETWEVYLANWLDGVTKGQGDETYNTIIDYARIMVQAAEDKAKADGWDGEKKLEYATDRVYDFIQKLQVDSPIQLTRDDVEDIVRGVYTEVSSWFNNFVPGTTVIEQKN